MKIPAIKDKTITRPGDVFGESGKCLVPALDQSEFWQKIYIDLSGELQYPILADRAFKIDPFFGYFGERFHPVVLRPKYFHIGIDVMTDKGVKIQPVADGLLEYSGFSELNGNYVMMSHPRVVTQDGFTLYSLYLHLEKFYFRFNLLQKIFREIGMKRFAAIPVNSKDFIGEVGATGNIRGLVSHLHVQLEFRDFKGTVIAVDPALALGMAARKNLTASISSVEEFWRFAKINVSKLSPWSKLWTKGGDAR